MRLPARRLPLTLLAAALLFAGGCSDDDGGDDDAAPSTTVETTTTAPDDGATTTAPGGDDATTTSDPGDGGGTTTAPDTSGQPPEGSGAPAEEAPDVSWDLDAAEYRGRDGERIAFLCPPDGAVGNVWGTGTYTDDSSVCSAAVHQGIINLVEGGRVVIEIAPGEDSYTGSESNGVTSNDYLEWQGSYTFPPS